MKITTKHPGYPSHVVRRAARWAAKQIGLDGKVLRTLNVEVGYRKSAQWKNGDTWGGWYKHGERLVQVLLGRNIRYPTPAGHNRSEADRFANDEWEVFVMMLATNLNTHAAMRSREHGTNEQGSTPNRACVRSTGEPCSPSAKPARRCLLSGSASRPSGR
jgi:hypothetical protein